MFDFKKFRKWHRQLWLKDDDGLIEFEMEEMYTYIEKSTKVCRKDIIKVIEAEENFLREQGIIY